MRSSLRFLVAVGLTLAGGCILRLPNGLAGKGTFDYQCTGYDPYCGETRPLGGSVPIPRAVARNASFRVTFDGGAEPASSAIVKRSATGLYAETVGFIGFLGDESDGEVVDVQRIEVVELDALSVGTSAYTLSEGDTVTLHVEARRLDRSLPGSVRATWTSDDPSIATVSPRGDGAAALTAVRTGVTTVRAASGDVVDAVTVRVNGPPAFDAGTEPADAADDVRDAGGDA